MGLGLVLCASELFGCTTDDAPPFDAAVPLDASLDAARDAAPDLDASSDEDAGADAGSRPEMMSGDDYVRYPHLEPADDGELIVRFAVPRGARSFVLTVTPATARRVLLVDLRGPDDALLFDGLAEQPTGPLARAVTYNLAESLPLSVLYPNAPDAPFGPGVYTARLFLDDIGAGEDPSASVEVVLGRPLDEQAPRALGLQLWVAAGASMTPDDILADATMVAAFDGVRAIFDAAGIEISDIGLSELGVPEDGLAIVDGEQATLRILDALSGYPGRGVHVVLVDRIETGPGKTVLGKTTGIPTPAAHAELARRGAVLIGLETLPDDPERIAELIAHEAAHSLGLRHTSEADGLVHDPLDDTPECPAERASFETPSGALVLTAEACADLDGSNLMFYTPPRAGDSQRSLTEDQVWVLTRNPMVL